MKPIWVKINLVNAVTARVVDERLHDDEQDRCARKAKIVRVIFTQKTSLWLSRPICSDLKRQRAKASLSKGSYRDLVACPLAEAGGMAGPDRRASLLRRWSS